MTANDSVGTAIVAADRFAIVKNHERLAKLIRQNTGNLGLGEFELERLTVPTGGQTSWEITTLAGDETVKEIEGVILAIRDGRAYWRQGIDDGGSGLPPDCTSPDMLTGVGDPGGPCARCPLSRFSPDGARPACKQKRLLLMVREQDRLPIIVQLPITSIKASRAFLRAMIQQGISRYEAVIAIGLEKDKSRDGITYSKAAFRMAGRLGETDAELMETIGEDMATMFAATPMATESENDS